MVSVSKTKHGDECLVRLPRAVVMADLSVARGVFCTAVASQPLRAFVRTLVRMA